MRKRIGGVLVAVLIFSMVFSMFAFLPQTTKAQSNHVDITAFGDSYTSGVGDYSHSGSCVRGFYTYMYFYSTMLEGQGKTTSVDNRACLGALSGDVIQQIQSAPQSTKDNSDIVFISTAGNDFDFSKVVASCFVAPEVINISITDGLCNWFKLQSTDNFETNAIGLTTAVLATADQHINEDAKIVLVGYPLLVCDSDNSSLPGSNESRDAVRAYGERLNDWQQYTVDYLNQSNPGRFEFFSRSDAFAGKEVCSSSSENPSSYSPYINPTGWMARLDGWEQSSEIHYFNWWHPNVLGNIVTASGLFNANYLGGGGTTTAPAPLDSDGDGIIDANDNCPYVSGPAFNNGCPYNTDELVFYNGDKGTMYDLSESGEIGSSALYSHEGWNDGWDIIETLEIDGDARPELLFYDATGGINGKGKASIYNLEDTGLGTKIAGYDTWANNKSHIVPADIDNDGTDELVFYNGDKGTIYDVSSNGVLSGSPLYEANWRDGWDIIVTAEIDGDARPELLLYDRSGSVAGRGKASVYNLEDSGLGSRIETYNEWSNNRTHIIPADIDADSTDELIFYNGDKGTVYDISTAGELESSALYSHSGWNDGWDIIVTLEVDRDQRPELLFYDSTGGVNGKGKASIYNLEDDGLGSKIAGYDTWANNRTHIIPADIDSN